MIFTQFGAREFLNPKRKSKFIYRDEMKPNKSDILKIRAALAEDLGDGDATSKLLIPASVTAEAYVLAKETGIFCGGSVAETVFHAVSPRLKVRLQAREGGRVKKGDVVLVVKGPLRAILAGERTALNFLGHLSGIATRTADFARKVRRYGTRILDTRKTTPLWRNLEKYAVKTGGGTNHRMGLYDAVFVKENHRNFGDLKKLWKHAGNFEIEVRDMTELIQALKLNPKVILLDNFTSARTKAAVKRARLDHPEIILEASGGITESNIAAYAAAGVDQISIGALTHSVKCLDFSLLIK